MSSTLGGPDKALFFLKTSSGVFFIARRGIKMYHPHIHAGITQDSLRTNLTPGILI